VLYGAGPRTTLEANAHNANENLRLVDLCAATKIVALAVRDAPCGRGFGASAGESDGTSVLTNKGLPRPQQRRCAEQLALKNTIYGSVSGRVSVTLRTCCTSLGYLSGQVHSEYDKQYGARQIEGHPIAPSNVGDAMLL
jgi:hypothetical protein